MAPMTAPAIAPEEMEPEVEEEEEEGEEEEEEEFEDAVSKAPEVVDVAVDASAAAVARSEAIQLIWIMGAHPERVLSSDVTVYTLLQVVPDDDTAVAVLVVGSVRTPASMMSLEQVAVVMAVDVATRTHVCPDWVT